VVRGYYNGLDSNQVLKLSQDIVYLSLEKNRKKPSVVFEQLKSIWPIYLAVIAAVVLFSIVVLRKRKK